MSGMSRRVTGLWTRVLVAALILSIVAVPAVHAGGRPGTVPTAFYLNIGINVVLGWGTNNAGQVGDGTTVDRLAPVLEANEAGLLGATQVAAGGDHTLVVAPSGFTTSVWAWGRNDHGQLGNGTTTDSSTPVQVETANGPLQGIVAVAAGSDFSFGIRFDGTLWAWGHNDHGQLGIGTTADSSLAVKVPTLDHVFEIEAGKDFAAAIQCVPCDTTGLLPPSGLLWTWGHNDRGQLASGTSGDSATPLLVHDPRQPSQPFPVSIPLSATAHEVATGGAHALAIRSDGTLWSWGDNSSGQLGIGSTTSESLPTKVPALGGVINLAAGKSFSLALDTTQTIYAWGDNSAGQLGNNSQIASSAPTKVVGYPHVTTVEMAAGDDFSLAASAGGKVWAWGDNSHGQLGNASGISSLVPVAVPGIASAISVAAGAGHSTILLADTVPPTTTLSFSPRLDSAGVVAGPVTVTLSAVDNRYGSGVAKTYFAVDDPTCTAPTALDGLTVPETCRLYTGPFIITTPGRHVIYFFSIDRGSNAEVTQFAAVTITAAKACPKHAAMKKGKCVCRKGYKLVHGKCSKIGNRHVG